jgi:hypothetical protein
VWPALLAAVTDRRGQITCVHRTWLDLAHRTKAPLADPRHCRTPIRHRLSHRITDFPAAPRLIHKL